MLHETFHLMNDSLTIARKIKNLKFSSFKELEILMKKESSYLKKLMSKKQLGGLALDVFEIEPLIEDDFSAFGNVLLTPHMGGSTEEAILAMGRAAIKGLDNYKDAIDFIENE